MKESKIQESKNKKELCQIIKQDWPNKTIDLEIPETFQNFSLKSSFLNPVTDPKFKIINPFLD